MSEYTKWHHHKDESDTHNWMVTIGDICYSFSFGGRYNELQYCEMKYRKEDGALCYGQMLMVGTKYKSLKQVKRDIKKHFQGNYFKKYERVYSCI